MSRILAISSYVASGHVGLAAIVPALQAMGHEVIAVPTVVLSCHYGHPHVGRVPVEASGLCGMLSALADNGTFSSLDAIITGYMPTAGMVEPVAAMLDGLAREMPDLLYLCDPVLGDDPGGLYVAEDAAAAIRDRLVPLADIVTPNRFEMVWLTGQAVSNAEDAVAAADTIDADLVAVTSVPTGVGVANVMSDAEGSWQFATPRLTGVPHGTGDLFAGLVLGHRLGGASSREAVSRASAGVAHVIAASIGKAELSLMQTIAGAIHVEPSDAVPVV